MIAHVVQARDLRKGDLVITRAMQVKEISYIERLSWGVGEIGVWFLPTEPECEDGFEYTPSAALDEELDPVADVVVFR